MQITKTEIDADRCGQVVRFTIVVSEQELGILADAMDLKEEEELEKIGQAELQFGIDQANSIFDGFSQTGKRFEVLLGENAIGSTPPFVLVDS